METKIKTLQFDDGLNYGPIIKDYTRDYKNIVNFKKNLKYPIFRWYPFKEGFSKDLVELLILDLSATPERCLDPFGGSGTTALTCQTLAIPCESIEINPFLHFLSKTKLRTNYSSKKFNKYRKHLTEGSFLYSKPPIPEMRTITERGGSKALAI